MICPHCSQKPSGIIGPGGRRHIVELEKGEKLHNFDTYTCPKCGHTELKKEIVEKEELLGIPTY